MIASSRYNHTIYHHPPEPLGARGRYTPVYRFCFAALDLLARGWSRDIIIVASHEIVQHRISRWPDGRQKCIQELSWSSIDPCSPQPRLDDKEQIEEMASDVSVSV
jgi:hypothetical protein